MRFKNTEIMNFKGALRGMRNPKESWKKSDSIFTDNNFIIGANDLQLMKRLIQGGAEHRKFLRQIFVCVDITAPLYWWKEFDTYKIGTTANSTSTMHRLTAAPITLECFEIDDMQDFEVAGLKNIIDLCNKYMNLYLTSKEKKYWKALIRLLPESWLQTRTVTLNYENIINIYHQRQYHKLNEWSGIDSPQEYNFCKWVLSLPCMKEILDF